MWQATGVTAQAGRTLSLLPTVGGTWSNAGSPWTAEGNATDILTQAENAPLASAPRMALVGRIGATGLPFLVGRGYQAPVTTTGELYLAPNDYWYQTSDNSGSLAVTVCPGQTPCSVDATATVPGSAEAGRAVSFASTAAATGCAGSPTFVWNFGDGTPTSAEPAPAHTYATVGTYTWTLTVQTGSATATRTGTIVVRVPAPPGTFGTRTIAGVLANDIVYDRFSGRLFASVPGSASEYANSVVVIDPEQATVETSISGWQRADPARPVRRRPVPLRWSQRKRPGPASLRPCTFRRAGVLARVRLRRRRHRGDARGSRDGCRLANCGEELVELLGCGL